MSSALTGNKIKDSYQALLKMGTNGSLDPITPIVISDGLGNDTPLQVSGNRFNTQYLASNIGLDLNFSGNAYTIGDYDFTSTTTQLKVDVNGQQIITNSSGGYRGFNLDFFNDSYQFGDINGVTNANLFVIDNASSIIKTMKSGNDIGLNLDFVNNNYFFGNIVNGNYGVFCYNNGTNSISAIGDVYGNTNGAVIKVDDNLGFIQCTVGSVGLELDLITETLKTNNNGNYIGLKLDFSTNNFYFGDFANIQNGTLFSVDDVSKLIRTYCSGSINGLQFDFNSKTYSFGDFNIVNNGTNFLIDDATQKMTFYTEFLNFVGATLQSGSSGGSSGQHLVITLNGNQYKIDLKNP